MSGNPQFTLAELAERFGLEAHGDPSTTVDGVGTLATATPNQFTFLSNPKYTSQLAESQAGIVVLAAESLPLRQGAALVAKDPYVAYAKIAALFEKHANAPHGIHVSAVVSPSARVHPSASVGPCCVIEDGAVIEEGVVLGPHCTIGPGCVVGAGSRLVARVTLVIRVTLGKRVLVHCVAAQQRAPSVAARYAVRRGIPAQVAEADLKGAVPRLRGAGLLWRTALRPEAHPTTKEA